MSPNLAGLYGTVKDLIIGERFHGIDANIIDYGFEGKDQERILEDGDFKTVHWQEALRSDLVIRHSATPKAVTDKVPFMLALHGRPINTFLLSFNEGRKNPIIETLYQAAEQPMFRGFISFWPHNTRIWREVLSPHPVYQIPAPVDLERFSPYGNAHKFKTGGDFNILIADMWREDNCPATPMFTALAAAADLEQTTGLNVKVHMVGVPPRARELFAIIKEKSRSRFIGEIFPMVANIEYLYRAADMVFTAHKIATRVVREPLACGTPVLTCDSTPDFIQSVDNGTPLTDAILKLIAKGRGATRRESRAYAEAAFDKKRAGAAMKTLFEKVLN
jgi:glycosyltransferase involved in cell wall biosynthesis